MSEMSGREISELEEGKALDVLVAEQVLRWRRSGYAYVDATGNARASYGVPPSFSTDIASAWHVVAALIQWTTPPLEPIELTCWPRGYNEPDPWWECRLKEAASPYNSWYGEGQSAPLAICRAALRLAAYRKEQERSESEPAEDMEPRRSAVQEPPTESGYAVVQIRSEAKQLMTGIVNRFLDDLDLPRPHDGGCPRCDRCSNRPLITLDRDSAS